MQQLRRIFLALALLAGFFISASAPACIYLDEDFEASEPFITNGTEGTGIPQPDAMVDPELPLTNGKDIRAWGGDYALSDSIFTLPLVGIYTNESTAVVTDRHFDGQASLEINPGASLRCGSTEFPYANSNPFLHGDFRVWQFALSVNESAAENPIGTNAGSFVVRYTTDSVNSSSEDLSFRLDLVVNPSSNLIFTPTVPAAGPNAITIYASSTNTSRQNLGQIRAGEGYWVMVTVLAVENAQGNIRIPWECWSPYELTNPFKGPQPVNPPTPNSLPVLVDAMTPSDFQQFYSGIYVFLGSNTPALHLTPDTDGTMLTGEIDWTLSGGENSPIYVDDMYWSNGMHSDIRFGFVKEQGARIDHFDKVSNEEPTDPTGGTSGAGLAWSKY
jgi:hypothetical protein